MSLIQLHWHTQQIFSILVWSCLISKLSDSQRCQHPKLGSPWSICRSAGPFNHQDTLAALCLPSLLLATPANRKAARGCIQGWKIRKVSFGETKEMQPFLSATFYSPRVWRHQLLGQDVGRILLIWVLHSFFWKQKEKGKQHLICKAAMHGKSKTTRYYDGSTLQIFNHLHDFAGVLRLLDINSLAFARNISKSVVAFEGANVYQWDKSNVSPPWKPRKWSMSRQHQPINEFRKITGHTVDKHIVPVIRKVQNQIVCLCRISFNIDSSKRILQFSAT